MRSSHFSCRVFCHFWKRVGRGFPRLAIYVLLCLSGGCALLSGPTSLPEPGFLPDPEVIYRKILERDHTVQTLNGTARIRIQNEEGSRRVDAVIACDRKGCLRFEVVDFLDHVLFLAVIREGSLLAYSVPENRYLQEPATPETLERIMGVPVGGEGLIALALGSAIFVPMNAPSLRMGQDSEGLFLEGEDAALGLRLQIRLDEQMRPIRSKLVSKDTGFGTQVVQVDFERYRWVNHTAFPFRIVVKDETGQGSFSIQYQRIFLNEILDQNLFQFQPPEGAGGMTW